MQRYILFKCNAFKIPIFKKVKRIHFVFLQTESNHALEYNEWSLEYNDTIGLLTGDNSINTHTNILIMTAEILRSKLRRDKFINSTDVVSKFDMKKFFL